ncbi:YhdH/YhfP family quinone oxidoreductase [Suttonella sp. R2A3]|uniref:YhdH/YhfP family quinone oxidoreductase n=1 Tax=Suttonella sp. R2A3 TaxID=2908648 RepID=UPI001F3F594E|nr:YhdH/YhfP family quinone oxidoreductase [Suttonella sp. R2A3]UJF24203.1 YhdH/YhfP family quinone oxidoreductase [Suttonella sp. R2A3]
MKAIRVHGFPQADSQVSDLPQPEAGEGEVLVQVAYSSINYKDMLAVTGAGKIMRNFPMTAGIDAAGVVAQDSSPYQAGDNVLITGCGLGEAHDGGFAEWVCVPQEWVIPLPEGWTSKTAMLLGTAGFSAAMAVDALIEHGITPKDGVIAVTGANGGVGLWAVKLLSRLGFQTCAFVRSPDDHRDKLIKDGADEVYDSETLTTKPRALDKMHFAGAIDQLGGDVLANLLAQTQSFGCVASIGMAFSPKLEMTVMPFILRGVTLTGISSSNCPRARRERIWALLAEQFSAEEIDQLPHGEIELNEVIEYCAQWSKHRFGRVLVRL